MPFCLYFYQCESFLSLHYLALLCHTSNFAFYNETVHLKPIMYSLSRMMFLQHCFPYVISLLKKVPKLHISSQIKMPLYCNHWQQIYISRLFSGSVEKKDITFHSLKIVYHCLPCLKTKSLMVMMSCILRET